MIKFLKTGLTGLALAVFAGAVSQPAMAQMQNPIITFHTQVYENQGASNVFSMGFGATKDTYIEIDYGYGPIEEKVGMAVFDSETSAISGTRISGTVSQEGIVKVYGDASVIDYLDLEGVYIDELDISAMKNVEILDLRHNLIDELDLSDFSKLQILYMQDNPFAKSPLVIGPKHPNLLLLDIQSVGAIDQTMTISDYPNLQIFQAYACKDLRHLDPTGCPKLQMISMDVTNVETLDVSKNPELLVLNVAETKINTLDLSNNKKLQQLYCDHTGSVNTDAAYKFTSLDLSNNTELQVLFASGNLLRDIDVSMCPDLYHLSLNQNYLTSLDVTQNYNLLNLYIYKNNMTFATLPDERSTFLDYSYQQRPYQIDRSYKVGTVLDFSTTMLREGTETYAAIMTPNPYDPAEMIDLGEEYYDYDIEKGLLTLKKEVTDSVYVTFHNNYLSSWDINTTKFMVKSEEDFGKPNPAATFRVAPTYSGAIELGIGIKGATPAEPKEFFVDFGDGELVAFSAQTEAMPETNNVSGSKKKMGNITIYVPEGDDLTALSVNGVRMSTFNIDSAPQLQYLSVTDCALPAISLLNNCYLCYINLNDNALKELDLGGSEFNKEKNLLNEVHARNNQIETFNGNANGVIRYIDLSHNNLTEFPMKQQKMILELDLSYNQLTDLNLESTECLETLNLEGNEMSSLPIPVFTPLQNLNVSLNRMPLSTLPTGEGIPTYTYAPQKEWVMAEKAPVVNLSIQNVEIDGNTTSYTWYTAADDKPVGEGMVKEVAPGQYQFTDTSVGALYAVFTNGAFPDFSGENAYRTQNVIPTDAPTNVVATFVPQADGDGLLTMTAAPGVTDAFVYVDWADSGVIEQLHIIDRTYTQFSGEVKSNKEAKVYSYQGGEEISVFSLSAGALKELDASKLKDLMAFMVYDSQLSEDKIKLPESPNLKSLSIVDGQFTTASFPQYPGLTNLTMSSNLLTSFDGSIYPNLERFVGGGNNITDMKFDNPSMWELDLTSNELYSVELTGLPAMQQLWLGYNHLSSIDVDYMRNLKVLVLTGNDFSLVTLPRQKSTWVIYDYAVQTPMKAECVDGKVDLSSQLEVGSYITSYQWFHDTPYVDENNEIQGDKLIEGEDYTIENGVTTFLVEKDNVMCVMLNTAFPNLIYYTYFLNVKPSGVDETAASLFSIISGEGTIRVAAGADEAVNVFGMDGRMAASGVTDFDGNWTAEGVAPGVYVVNVAGKSVKVLVK
ncbi:MAG: hypothetical protein HDR80_10460 [Bacteroides sp.]|nr:hypothetical protein [Bacteroides sp.]